MTADELAAIGRIEARLCAQHETLTDIKRWCVAHDARQDTIADASQTRHLGIEHRVTRVEGAVKARTLAGVLVAVLAGLTALAQALGITKPGP